MVSALLGAVDSSGRSGVSRIVPGRLRRGMWLRPGKVNRFLLVARWVPASTPPAKPAMTGTFRPARGRVPAQYTEDPETRLSFLRRSRTGIPASFSLLMCDIGGPMNRPFFWEGAEGGGFRFPTKRARPDTWSKRTLPGPTLFLSRSAQVSSRGPGPGRSGTPAIRPVGPARRGSRRGSQQPHQRRAAHP